MSLSLQLYTKPGCHLCERAEADLARLQRRYPHALKLIDITADADLARRYGELIPVLEVAGRTYSAPLPAATLERALSEASREAGAS